MKLIITEKKSVAEAIASALGVTEKKRGYLQGAEYLISWCVGHLVSLAPAQQYSDRYVKWRHEDLPILPDPWQYTVLDASGKRFNTLKQLMNDPRVDTIVCATDAGREGELIFRLVYQQCGCGKPVERLWISSLEESSIRHGLMNLHDSHEYDNLYQAALCRAQADWLVGINATRLYSLLYGQTLHVGRVMSPTLAMIVDREAVIAAFQPETYYTVQINCGFPAQTERIKDKAEAQRVQQECNHQTAVVKQIDKKQKSEKPPQLYDLTSLQRDANKLFGYTAQQTLDYAQALYEKKLLTYPRTDSITSDMEQMLPRLVSSVAAAFPFTAGLSLPVNPTFVIDDGKVSDHHAIIPTQSMPQSNLLMLPTGEMDILQLVSVRLLCAVGSPHIFDETVVKLECGGIPFNGKGKAIVQMGWRIPEATYRGSVGGRIQKDQEKREYCLPDLKEGQQLSPVTASLQEGQTTPPASYTEGTLLAAMEAAGAADQPEDAERKGLGTPATRAGIIEKLIKVGLVERKGSGKAKHLIPTAKGQALVKVLPKQLCSPAMTAELEQQLKQIEHGEASANDFMRGMTAYVRDLVHSATVIPDAHKLFPSNRPKLGDCPCCGSAVSETPKGFFCENRTCRFGIWKDNRFLASKGKPPTAEMVSALLRDGHMRLTGLLSESKKKPYDAVLLLECDEEGKARLRLVFDQAA